MVPYIRIRKNFWAVSEIFKDYLTDGLTDRVIRAITKAPSGTHGPILEKKMDGL